MSALLTKFQYVFKVFFMLNIDRKKFNEYLIKLEGALHSKQYQQILNNSSSMNILTKSTPNDHGSSLHSQLAAMNESSSHSHHDNVNAVELKEIICRSILFYL